MSASENIEQDAFKREEGNVEREGRRRALWGFVAVIAVAIVLVVAGWWLLNGYFFNEIEGERTSQMTETIEQVGATFAYALDSDRNLLTIGQNILEGASPATADDIAATVAGINETTNADADDGLFFILLDSHGRSWDTNGQNGIWADYAQIGEQEQCTFIADSRSYADSYWAFVQKLAEPIATSDGSVTITHIVLLHSVAALDGLFVNQAYEESGETYILDSAGVRMYDTDMQEDTLATYNVFKELREAEEAAGGDFDAVLQALESDGVATSQVSYGGVEYCYSLYTLGDYGAILLFLIPAQAMAAHTMNMVQSLVMVLVVAAIVVAVFASAVVFAFSRMRTHARLYELSEQNLAEQEAINARLQDANESLASARRAAEGALVVADSANKAKSNFLSNMSHDIRTPLNAIVGFEKLLRRDAEDPAKVREYAGKIEMSSQHLLNLINDVLDMSRIESGKTTLTMEEFAVNRVLYEVRDIAAVQAAAKGQTLQVETELPDAFAVVGDQTRLGQILVNLATNAVKYTPEGGRVGLAVRSVDAQASGMTTLAFVVRDNGIGMSEEFQKRMFDPFEREDDSVRSNAQGSGLGLAISKSLVNLMGGRIVVESEPGAGSVFTVELSFRMIDAKGGMPLAGTGIDGGAHAPKDALRGLHVLVAEDNDLNAEIANELLRAEGATCDVARNGQEALEMFRASEPGTYAVILMDIQMPVMDGYQATRAIRACGHLQAKDIPIAAMSANAFVEDKEKALASGMNAHIPKPVDMEQVREFVASSLDRA